LAGFDTKLSDGTLKAKQADEDGSTLAAGGVSVYRLFQ